jgi:hypothetical protein
LTFGAPRLTLKYPVYRSHDLSDHRSSWSFSVTLSTSVHMRQLSAALVNHGLFDAVDCALCGRAWDEHWVRIALVEDGSAIGSLCPACLSRPPRETASMLWQRGALLRAALGHLPPRREEQAQALYELGARIARVRARTRQLCATAKALLAKSAALREELLRLRQEFADAFQTRSQLIAEARRLSSASARTGQPILSPGIARDLEETVAGADALLALSDHVARLPHWPISVEDVIRAERQAFVERHADLGEGQAQSAVDDRYRNFLASCSGAA